MASFMPVQKAEEEISGTKRVGGMVNELVERMQLRRELLMTRGGEDFGEEGEQRATGSDSRMIRTRSSESDSDGWDD